MKDILFSTWGGQIVDNRGKDPEDYEPVDHVELPEYFKQDEKIKALIGWYGMIIRSSDVDIIDFCRGYLTALHDYSKDCGKCNYCKTGFEEMLEVIQDITDGNATEEDMEFLTSATEAVVDSCKCSIGRMGPKPFLEALKYFADDFTQAGNGERTVTKGVYHSQMTAPCMDACPIHLDIPTYIEFIKDAKFTESLDVIRQCLPLPGVLGRACFRPCEAQCRRANLDEPIAIRGLKRFVSDHCLAAGNEIEIQITPSEKTGRVAVVGAGPAGVTCAYHLALKGHQVTIYESLSEPGGMAAVGIPDYRVPREILKDEIAQVEKMGVNIQYNQTVGGEIKLSQLEDEFDAVFVGIGAQQSSIMEIEGENEGYAGFIPGLEYLAHINAGQDPCLEGKKIAVIGGGNVAIDCVRSSFRVNKEEVHLIYRRTRNEMPADDVEIHDAEEEGVNFHFLTAPVRIVAENGKVAGIECIRMELGEPDESGRARPVAVEGSAFVFDCDVVVPAIGQKVDLSLLEGMEGLDATKWRTIMVDEFTKQSNHPKIFCAGDCETGPDALVTACAGGQKAAESIDGMINGKALGYDDDYYFEKLLRTVKILDRDEKILKVETKPRFQQETLAPESRKKSFEEVEQSFSDPEAVAEAERCLKCYQVATIAV
jgi:formate dehydrogenase (NADP+) beta subunit